MAIVLVTGGAGFIGSHLVETLVGAGHRVRVLDDLSSGSLRNLREVRQSIDFLRGDIRDAERRGAG
jgi:UDP-glucose 4-epimerase